MGDAGAGGGAQYTAGLQVRPRPTPLGGAEVLQWSVMGAAGVGLGAEIVSVLWSAMGSAGVGRGGTAWQG